MLFSFVFAVITSNTPILIHMYLKYYYGEVTTILKTYSQCGFKITFDTMCTAKNVTDLLKVDSLSVCCNSSRRQLVEAIC